MSGKKDITIIIAIATIALLAVFFFSLSRYLNINISIYRNSDISKSQNLDTSQYRNSDISKSQNLDISKSRNLDISIFRNLDISTITLLAVGDIMLSRGVQYKIDTAGQGDFLFPFLKIAPELNRADIVFGNLEGPISDKGERVGSIYSFRAKPEATAGLVFAGFDILSLANNHMFDYQSVSLEETMRLLTEAGIDYVGAGFNQAEAFGLKIKEIKGVKIGFLAYTDLGPYNWQAGEDRAGIAWISQGQMSEIKQAVAEAKQKTDILIVSLHSGEEYAKDPSAFQVFFAKDCIDSGADLIIEHHPHVIQRLEQYKNSWIAYSLGNFVFDQYFSEDTMQGGLLVVGIKDKKIVSVSLETIKLNKNYQPELISTQ